MPKKRLEAIEEHFSKVMDPRVDRTKKHKLIEMIAIAICAVICGAEGGADIENFGNGKLPWLQTFLELPNGIPLHDTFGRVFSMLDVQQFQLAFSEQVLAINEVVHGQILNIDGKRLAGSEDRLLGKGEIYMGKLRGFAPYGAKPAQEIRQRWYPRQATPSLLEGRVSP